MPISRSKKRSISPTRPNDDHRALVAAIRAGGARRAREIHAELRKRSGIMPVELLRRLGLGNLQ